MLTKEEMLKVHDMLTRMDLNDAYTREGLSPILDRNTAKETGRTKSEVLKDMIKRESHLLYYGYYPR